MRDDPVVVDLVLRARAGDQRAWDEIVERFAPLVWGICMRHRLSPADADDVGQSLWLGLLEHLQTLREPAALPGWIATTTRRECLRLHDEARRRRAPVEGQTGDDDLGADPTAVPVDEGLLIEELRAAVRAAFARLAPALPPAARVAGQRPAAAVRPDRRDPRRPGRRARSDARPLSGETAPERGTGGVPRRGPGATMTGNGWWDDDEELLALLRDALAEQHDVPARFVEAGKASFAWHSIDAELAALAYDSVADPSPFAGRAGPTAPRSGS